MAAQMQAGQAALSMMSAEQRKQAMEQTLAKATPEERKQIQLQQKQMMKAWEKASPEEKQAMAQQQQTMKDVGAYCQGVKPDGANPNKELSTVDCMCAMATCPSFEALHETIKNLDAEEKKKTVMGFITLERALMEHASEEDAAGLRDSKDVSGAEKRRALLLLMWVLYRAKAGDSVPLDERFMGFVEGSKRLATKVLMQAQMLLPQQRWIKATIATSRLAALLVNELWSHDDDECKSKMSEMLQKQGESYPVLSLRARTVLAAQAAKEALEQDELGAPEGWTDAQAEPAVGLPKQELAIQVELTRGHAAAESAPATPTAENPQGILEAWWLYVEGIKPEGTPNVMIAAQPLVVKDLSTPVLRTLLKFEAPPSPDTYKLLVHVCSTTVVGSDMRQPISFVVQEDDVPALE